MTAPYLDRIATWRQAREAAETAGWELLATGDWSWVYVSPDGLDVWRITPFDPAFERFVAVVAELENEHLPRVTSHARHRGAGSSTIMERLDEVGEDEAKEWLSSLETATLGPLNQLRVALSSGDIGRDTPLFRGLDLNPANVLRRPGEDALVFTDAFWIDGPRLLELVRLDPGRALASYPAHHLREWAYLPCMDEPTTALILQQIAD